MLYQNLLRKQRKIALAVFVSFFLVVLIVLCLTTGNSIDNQTLRAFLTILVVFTLCLIRWWSALIGLAVYTHKYVNASPKLVRTAIFGFGLFHYVECNVKLDNIPPTLRPSLGKISKKAALTRSFFRDQTEASVIMLLVFVVSLVLISLNVWVFTFSYIWMSLLVWILIFSGVVWSWLYAVRNAVRTYRQTGCSRKLVNTTWWYCPGWQLVVCLREHKCFWTKHNKKKSVANKLVTNLPKQKN